MPKAVMSYDELEKLIWEARHEQTNLKNRIYGEEQLNKKELSELMSRYQSLNKRLEALREQKRNLHNQKYGCGEILTSIGIPIGTVRV